MRAMDIEAALVWAFRRQCVEAYMAALRDASGVGGAGGQWDAISRAAALGCVVSGGGAVDLAARAEYLACDPDAVLIWETLNTPNGLDDRTRMLLAMHARSGTRPDWCEDQVVEYVVGANGRVLLETQWDPVAGRLVSRPRVRKTPTDAEVEAMRRDWSTWRRGLVMMQAALAGALAFEVTGPAAADAPWLATSPRRTA